MALVAAADHEIVRPVRRMNLHDVPEDRHRPDLDQRFRWDRHLLADPSVAAGKITTFIEPSPHTRAARRHGKSHTLSRLLPGRGRSGGSFPRRMVGCRPRCRLVSSGAFRRTLYKIAASPLNGGSNQAEQGTCARQPAPSVWPGWSRLAGVSFRVEGVGPHDGRRRFLKSIRFGAGRAGAAAPLPLRPADSATPAGLIARRHGGLFPARWLGVDRARYERLGGEGRRLNDPRRRDL